MLSIYLTNVAKSKIKDKGAASIGKALNTNISLNKLELRISFYSS